MKFIKNKTQIIQAPIDQVRDNGQNAVTIDDTGTL